MHKFRAVSGGAKGSARALPAGGWQQYLKKVARAIITSFAPGASKCEELEGKPMQRIVCAFCCLALTAIPALSQKKAGGMTDQEFVDFAAQTDMVEANLGQLAQSASTTQAVKDYAQGLATDHTADYSQLGTIAQQANLKFPGSIDSKNNKAMVEPFQKLKGAAFDHKYVQEMVAGHTKAIEIFKKEAANASNGALKDYAQKDLDVLKNHLDGAKNLEKPAAK